MPTLAQRLGSRQIEVLSTDTFPLTLVYYPCKVIQFEFQGYGAGTDEVTITDRNGVILWDTQGETDLSNERSGRVGWTNGLIVTQLTAGRLLIYLE
jgi:hypothetical protein